MKALRFLLLLIVILTIIYFLGPKPTKTAINPKFEALQVDISEIDAFVQNHEFQTEHLKKGNEAEIVWADATHQKTPYALVYLHGFSASEQEGDPIHREFAKRYNMNAYLARLSEHGLENGYSMVNLTVGSYLESAKKALAIGSILGDSVIIMATSTGATLGLYLASTESNIAGLICYSPNIRVRDPNAFLLNNPWGKEIAQMILGGPIYTWEGDDSTQAYWTTSYPVDALVNMQELLEETMVPETFEKVKIPVFLGYYYKSDTAQDKVVSVEKQLEMFDQLGTPDNKKVKIAFPEAGHHVIASRHKSADLKSVRKETFKFADEVLSLN